MSENAAMSEMFENPLFEGLPQARDLRLYIEEGRPTNHFLTALLSNDLLASLGRADAQNYAALQDYAMWLRSYAPAQSFGSVAAVEKWIAHRGLKGP